MNELKAIESLIKSEVTDEYDCKFTVTKSGNDSYLVSFPAGEYGFNAIELKVISVDDESPEFSTFSICIHEDTYEEFVSYDSRIKELWKGLLWK